MNRIPNPIPQRKSLFSNISWLAGANIFVKPLWFFFLILTVRFLGAEELGKYTFIISFIALVSVLYEGGIDLLFIREISARPDNFKKFFSNSLLSKFLLIIPIGFTAFILSKVLDFSTETRQLLWLAIIYAATYSLLLHIRCIFRAFENLKFEALSIVVEKLSVIILCSFALLTNSKATYFMLFFNISYIFTLIFTFIVAYIKFGFPPLEFDLNYIWSNIIKPALPFALMNIFIVIYFRSGTLMLSALTKSDELIGYYNAGYRIIEGFMFIPFMIATSLFPFISRNKDNLVAIQKTIIQITKIMLSIALLIAIPFLMFKENLTILLLGNNYINASLAIGIVTLAIIPISLTAILGTVVASTGRQSKANIFIVIGTILNIILNYLLIPIYGAEGASITTVFTEIFIFLVTLWIIRDYLPISKVKKIGFKVCILVLTIFLIKYIVSLLIVSFILQLLICILILFLSMYRLKILGFSEMKELILIK
jgi:O-antigen/teichoic acid export membrane protein